jgi:hypothetical protein
MIGLPIGVQPLPVDKNADTLVGIVKDVLHKFGVEYRGCAGGHDCLNADRDHTTPETAHLVCAGTSDNGGADPIAIAKLACNPQRCIPHIINLVYKEVTSTESPDDLASTCPNLGACVTLLQKVVSIVKFFRASSKYAEKLRVAHVIKAPFCKRHQIARSGGSQGRTSSSWV